MREITRMLKAIHTHERKEVAWKKARDVAEKFVFHAAEGGGQKCRTVLNKP